MNRSVVLVGHSFPQIAWRSKMKRLLMGVCSLAIVLISAFAIPTPASAGSSNAGAAIAGGAVGFLLGTATANRRPYYAPPPVVYQPAPPVYANNCAPRYIAGGWCNVSACWKACGGAYRSFDPYSCTYQPYDGPRQRCYR
jgi:hypothetical protein